MKTARFITPDGVEVEVPEADAFHFDNKGWPRAGGKDNAGDNDNNTAGGKDRRKNK